MTRLKIQDIIKMDDNNKFALIKSHTQEELISAIQELERIQNKTCKNCKRWYSDEETPSKGYCMKLGVHNIGGCGDYFEEMQK